MQHCKKQQHNITDILHTMSKECNFTKFYETCKFMGRKM